MSSPEYAELRGVMGNAVTAKAAILTSDRKRSLLFFLQALSLEKGGLRAGAERLFEMFPERVGTPSMVADGVRAGRKLTDRQVGKIRFELDLASYCEHEARRPKEGSAQTVLDDDWGSEEREQERLALLARAKEEARRAVQEAPHDAEHYVARCRNPEKLAAFLIDLCINPRLLIAEPGQSNSLDEEEIARFSEQHEGLSSYHFKTAKVHYFHDLCGALFEFQKRYAVAAGDSIAKTNVAKKVMGTLDACLKARRMVLIEGESDSGKSTAAEAWCRMHKGEARFVRLQGVTNKTVFFRAIARALGVASSYMRTAKEMQARIEDVLQRSGLVLVLDESQYAFAQSERIYSRPELVDWIYTACCNHGVPVALIATPLFSKRLHQAERQTIWNSDQFKRRIYRYEILPPKPTRNDIELVVKHHLPDGDAASQKYLAGYAITATHPFTAIADALADAAQIAESDGRQHVIRKDLEAAVLTYRYSSELAKRQTFDEPRKAGRKGNSKPLQTPCATTGEPIQDEHAEDTFTGPGRPVAAIETTVTRASTPALSDA